MHVRGLAGDHLGGDDPLLERSEVDIGLGRGDRRGEVEPFLHELESGHRVGGVDRGLDLRQSGPHGVGRALSAPLGPMRVERLEIAADRPSLRSAFGERSLVLVGHLLAWCHGVFPRRGHG